MGELLKQEQSSKQRRINNYQSLGNQAELTLFNTLERNEQISRKSQIKANSSELAYLIATIKNVDIDEIIDSNPQRPNTRSHLQQLLEHNHLIGRDVLISGENIKSDCGDLIAFEEESGAAILLKTTTRGYQVLALEGWSQQRTFTNALRYWSKSVHAWCRSTDRSAKTT